MEIGIIGSTGHLNYVINGLKRDDESRIAGLAPGPENNIEKLYQNLKSVKPDLKKYEDYTKMLDTLDLDIGIVANYFGNHAEVIQDLLSRNISVFTEKPIATNLENLDIIKQACRRSDVEMVSMLGSRYKPWFLAAKRAVDEGKIGEIRLINAQKSYKLGERDDFYKNRATYGGTIPWVGSQAIDWLNWTSGEKFESVCASHSRRGNKKHGDLKTTAICNFEMTNDVIASVSLDYLRPEQALTHGDDRLRLAASEGIIEVRNKKAKLINPETNGVKRLSQPDKKQMFLEFLEKVRTGNGGILTAEDSIYNTEACLKARKSADENKIVYF